MHPDVVRELVGTELETDCGTPYHDIRSTCNLSSVSTNHISVAEECSVSRQPLIGVLLYGSRGSVRGRLRRDSDVDLLCLTADDLLAPVNIFRRYDDVVFDLMYMTVSAARQGLYQDHAFNTNQVLNALTGGVVLLDRNNITRDLVSVANKRKQAGPPPIGAVERRNSELQIAMALQKIDAFVDSENSSQIDISLANVWCSMQFRVLIYAYCRTRRIWASSLGGTIQWAEKHCTDLYNNATLFLRAETVRQRREALYKMYHAVFQL
jgi:hypothetical protein